MTRPQIPMERRLREIGDLKLLSVKPLVQVSEETELQMGGLLCVTLLGQKGRIGRYNTAQRALVHVLRKVRICKSLVMMSSPFMGCLRRRHKRLCRVYKRKRIDLLGIQTIARHSSELGIVAIMPISA